MAANKNMSGFSLVELMVSLTIMSVFLSAGLSMMIGGKAEHIEDSQDRLEVVKDALTDYRMKNNNRLPCPAPLTVNLSDETFGRGIADCKASAVDSGTFRKDNVRVGAVPVRDLGLDNKYAFDKWGNRFSYVVSEDAVDGTDTETGLITVLDDSGLALPNQPVYIAFSHGPDGRGAFNYSGNMANPCDDSITERKDFTNCNYTMAADVDNADVNFRVASFNDGQIAKNRFDDLVDYGFSSKQVPSCSDEQKLQWDGDNSQWVCVSDTLQVPANCNPGQVLSYQADDWQCVDMVLASAGGEDGVDGAHGGDGAAGGDGVDGADGADGAIGDTVFQNCGTPGYDNNKHCWCGCAFDKFIVSANRRVNKCYYHRVHHDFRKVRVRITLADLREEDIIAGRSCRYREDVYDRRGTRLNVIKRVRNPNYLDRLDSVEKFRNFGLVKNFEACEERCTRAKCDNGLHLGHYKDKGA